MSTDHRQTVDRDTVIATLTAARALLAEPGVFLTGAYATTWNGEPMRVPSQIRGRGRRFDLLGAIEQTTSDLHIQNACTTELQQHVCRIAEQTGHLNSGLSQLNDRYGKPAVMALLAETIEHLQHTDDQVDAWSPPALPAGPPTRTEWDALTLEHQLLAEMHFASDWWAGQHSSTPSDNAQVSSRISELQLYLDTHATACAAHAAVTEPAPTPEPATPPAACAFDDIAF